MDCLISGSDQVWNVESYRGFDPAFFLDFEWQPGVTKASYAATFGGATDFGPHRQRVGELLQGLDFISVRDAHSESAVRELASRAAKRVVDPSFLVDFGPITPPPIRREPYIVVYCMERTPELLEVVRAVREKLRLPVVSIRTTLEGAQSYGSAGPREWLSLMKYASFIVTNSFHGLCFAIINRKNFLVVPHRKGQMRLDDLLEWLNLNNRVVADESAVQALETGDLEVDYSATEGLLAVAIRDSLEFLREVLRG